MNAMTSNINARRPILAKVVGINSKELANVEEELARLLLAASRGEIRGISYAATSAKGRNLIGRAGSHRDSDKAVGALFRAAVALLMIE